MVRANTTRICGSVDEKCFRTVEEELARVEEDCMCYEKCESIKYELEIVPEAYVLYVF
jgi:hypothetical protein